MKHTYQVVVGNIGLQMDYTKKKLAYECYNTYVTASISGETRTAGQTVTLIIDGEVKEEHRGRVDIISPENKLATLLDIDKCKIMYEEAKAKKESCVILACHYSINIANKYNDDETLQSDLEELEEYLGELLEVSQYDDLVINLVSPD